MARYETNEFENAVQGAAQTGDLFFQLGMMYSTGRTVPTDRVEAHKWFNLAALKGKREGVLLRKEIAAEMTEEEIASAQRAAREYLTSH